MLFYREDFCGRIIFLMQYCNYLFAFLAPPRYSALLEVMVHVLLFFVSPDKKTQKVGGYWLKHG